MHSYSVKEVMKNLKTSEKGLKSSEIANRFKKYGRNEIKKKDSINAFRILLSQFTDPIIYVLIAAVILSAVVHETTNAIVIGAIILLNAAFGFVQEYKAEKAIELLKKFETVRTRVIRNGMEQEVDAVELVPGDIIVINAGDKIPADARLIWNLNLKTNEAVLTGESEPVNKTVNVLPPKTPLADRVNMVFAGTIAVDGRAKAVVIATNEYTEIGKIAKLVKETVDAPTPLQNRLKELGKWITIFSIVAAAIIIPVGLFRNLLFYDVFMQTISLAVSAIPVGLPAVVTICLALGVRRMIKRKAIIKRLKSVETLGSVTVICSDKTGTITKNEMTVTDIFANDKLIKVTGSGYKTKGDFLVNGRKVSAKNIELLLRASSSCNNATLKVGDPTEIALLVAAEKADVKRDENRLDEVPFSSEKKYMLTRHVGVIYVKGALEKVLSMCNFIIIDGKKRRLIKRDVEKIMKVNEDMADRALRVLAVASGKSEKDLAFLGLIGMIDPPRSEVKDAIKLCRLAGIRPIIITGDQKLTALAVAKGIGIDSGALVGDEIDKLSDDKLKKVVKEVSIFCRTTSEHKVRILNALQENGEVVAMTGDGVNDAPALKKADVGVAMNIKGTDVSKEVADIVLVDDNFASIVSAVKEGRGIYDNIKKFIKFQLSANFDEIALVLTAIFFGLPLPLLPIHILWINFVTDSFPALALGVDPPERDIMSRKPRPPKEGILKGVWGFLVIATILAFVISIVTFLVGLKTGSIERARTLTLTAAIVVEMFIAFAARTDKSVFKVSPFENKWLLGAVFLALALHFTVVYSPLNIPFGLVPLTFLEVLAIFGASALVFVIFESTKLLKEIKKSKV
ncbi:MAG: HAD-IC family P-type ATPase [archaeon]